jgi:hypothetical protein
MLKEYRRKNKFQSFTFEKEVSGFELQVSKTLSAEP